MSDIKKKTQLELNMKPHTQKINNITGYTGLQYWYLYFCLFDSW